jgi:hypothetical protein
MSSLAQRPEFRDLFMPWEERIAKAAICCVELQKRGADLTKLGLSRGFVEMLLNVGHGRLLLEVAAQFSSKMTLVSKLACLSHRTQKQLLGGKPVEVLTATGAVKSVAVDRLTATEARQVFDGKRILTVAEQRKGGRL